MESKLGLKDIVLLLLATSTLVAVGLLWKQIDRSWDRLGTSLENSQKQVQALESLTQEVRASREKNQQAIEAFQQATQALLAVAAQRPAATDDPADADPDPDGGADPEATSAGNPDLDAALATLAVAGRDAASGQGPAPVENDFFELRRTQREEDDFALGGEFVDAFASIVRKITPYVSSDTYGSRIQSYVVETLAERDYDDVNLWRPNLAESWTISDDGLTFTFKLRPEANFSDGTPLRASDVVFTYEWIMNPRVDTPRAKVYYEKLKSVTALDPHTVEFVFAEPYFLSFSVAAQIEVLSEAYYSRFTPEQFNELPGLLFGSGPYKLQGDPAEWRPTAAEPVVLVRNDNYWGVPSALDRIVYRIITDPNARLSTFQNGELDMFIPSPDQYDDTIDNERLRRTNELYIHEPVVSGYRYIGWNQRKPDGSPTAFSDRRVRQAMTMLIDRQRMADDILKGRGSVATGPFHRLNPQADPDIRPWPYDPERAKALLAEAGFSDSNGDGVLDHPQYGPLIFKLMIPSGSPTYLRIANAAAESMRRAGVVMEADPTDWNIMIQKLNERDFDASALGWSASVEGDPKQIFHSDSIEGGGDNSVAYANPEFDAVIDQARQTMDPEQRYPLWRQAHRILHEDQPYTFLFTSQSVQLVHKRFAGDRPTALGLTDRFNWYVPQAEQRN